MRLKEIFLNKEVVGEMGKNVGLGIFVSGIYGLSDTTFETFNLVDIGIGFLVMLMGIVLERS